MPVRGSKLAPFFTQSTQRRQDVSITTGSLAAAASENGVVGFARAGTIIRLEASHALRIRLYATAAARDADAARAVGAAPTDDIAGSLLLDVVVPTASGALSLNLSGAIAYNADSPPAPQLYYRIENRDTVARVLTATLTFIPGEG